VLIVRRRAGRLLAIEADILEVAIGLKARGIESFHGFSIAKLIQQSTDARRLTAHGTLYKALARLEKAGLLTSDWEDPDEAAREGRPRRRLYHVTDMGERAMTMVREDTPLPSAVWRRLATE
jgi:DNA-binding PadR family transcriptional regulator